MAAGIPESLLWGLRRYLAAPQATVSAWQRQPFQGGLSGSALEYWRLSLRRAGLQQSITLVYKGGGVVEGAFMRGAAHREALAYANLPGNMPLDMPTAVAFDAMSGDLWLLPFPPGKHTSHWQADWNGEDVEQTLSDLARLHLTFWNEEERLQRWPWLLRPVGNDAPLLLASAAAGLDALAAESAYDEQLTPARVARLRRLVHDPTSLLNRLNEGSRTLLHGDAGYQNIAISADGRQRLWYDWQLVATGPPALDLATYLHPWCYPQANPPFPLAEMIDHYLAALARRGQYLAPEAFRRRLDAALLWRWLIQWAPLLGQYRARLQPAVRERLYHTFTQLHWPALDRWPD